MRLILIALGSLLAILFIIKLNKGKRFESLVCRLDSNAYPMNTLYGVGFAWSSTKIFKLKGKIADKLMTQAGILYEPQYAEYYANVVWAQTITLIHLFLTMTFLIAAIMYELAGFMLLVGIFMCVFIATYCLEGMKNALAKRTEECDAQLPEAVSTMAVLVNSGMVLRDAWNMVAENGEGALYELMRKASVNMKNGLSDTEAIYRFGKVSNSSEIRKFSSALLQSMERGGSELTVFLINQSSELWHAKRQYMLQNGEKAATKLLLPIVLIFLGIIIIVMTAAFAGSLF